MDEIAGAEPQAENGPELRVEHALILRALLRAGALSEERPAPFDATAAQLSLLAKQGLIETVPGSEAFGRVLVRLTREGSAALMRSLRVLAVHDAALARRCACEPV